MILYLSILSLLDLSALAFYIYSLRKHQQTIEEHSRKLEQQLAEFRRIKADMDAFSASPIAQALDAEISAYFEKINSLLREKKSLASEPREE